MSAAPLLRVLVKPEGPPLSPSSSGVPCPALLPPSLPSPVNAPDHGPCPTGAPQHCLLPLAVWLPTWAPGLSLTPHTLMWLHKSPGTGLGCLDAHSVLLGCIPGCLLQSRDVVWGALAHPAFGRRGFSVLSAVGCREGRGRGNIHRAASENHSW